MGIAEFGVITYLAVLIFLARKNFRKVSKVFKSPEKNFVN
jgi:hypothetical protein